LTYSWTGDKVIVVAGYWIEGDRFLDLEGEEGGREIEEAPYKNVCDF